MGQLIAPVIGGAAGASGPIAGAVAGSRVASAAAFGKIFEALGGVFEVFGSLRKATGAQEVGFAQAQAAGYWAAVARNNRIIAERAAEDVLARGRADVARRARATRLLVGRQRTALAGAGQLVDVGSALELTAEAQVTGKLDELTIRNIAERQALGFRTQGTNFEAEAVLADMRRREALRQGASTRRTFLFEAGTSLLSTASKTAARFFFRR